MLLRLPSQILVALIVVPLVCCLNHFRTIQNSAKTLKRLNGVDFTKIVGQLVGQIDVIPDPQISEPLPYHTSLTFPTISTAEIYVHYAAASYCDEKLIAAYTCKECRKTGPYTKLVKVVKNEKEKTLGFVSVESFRREIIVTFRGINNPTNVMRVFAFDWTDSPYNDGIRFHTGFYVPTMSIYSQVLSLVKSLSAKLPNYRVVLTGHSLGGAMATIGYYLFKHERDLPNLNYVLITFGEPRSGNRQFADYINNQNITAARVVNGLDLVPHLNAASAEFVHHLREYWTYKGKTRICNAHNYEDLSCSASQPSKSFNFKDHLFYFGTFIGLNCIEESPVRGISKLFGLPLQPQSG